MNEGMRASDRAGRGNVPDRAAAANEATSGNVGQRHSGIRFQASGSSTTATLITGSFDDQAVTSIGGTNLATDDYVSPSTAPAQGGGRRALEADT